MVGQVPTTNGTGLGKKHSTEAGYRLLLSKSGGQIHIEVCGITRPTKKYIFYVSVLIYFQL